MVNLECIDLANLLLNCFLLLLTLTGASKSCFGKIDSGAWRFPRDSVGQNRVGNRRKVLTFHSHQYTDWKIKIEWLTWIADLNGK